MALTNDQIQAAALAAGFTLKSQPDGSMALHQYVFEFARAVLAAGQQAAQDQIADLRQEEERSNERFHLALLSSSQWQHSAPNCSPASGMSGAHWQRNCRRGLQRGTGKEPA